ncbi:MAG: PAS domain S-box protein, partial [Alcaligenaceae bacterium]
MAGSVVLDFASGRSFYREACYPCTVTINGRFMSTQRHLQSIINSAIDFAIIATDRSGVVTEWNRGAEHILGWTRENMIGSPVDCMFTPEDRAGGRVQKEMHIADAEGAALDERWHMRSDGTRFWASGELMQLRGETGLHRGYVKILRDLSRQREYGERLRISEERFKYLFETIDTAYAVLEVKFDCEEKAVDFRFPDIA